MGLLQNTFRKEIGQMEKEKKDFFVKRARYLHRHWFTSYLVSQHKQMFSDESLHGFKAWYHFGVVIMDHVPEPIFIGKYHACASTVRDDFENFFENFAGIFTTAEKNKEKREIFERLIKEESDRYSEIMLACRDSRHKMIMETQFVKDPEKNARIQKSLIGDTPYRPVAGER